MHLAYQFYWAELDKSLVEVANFGTISNLWGVSDRCTLTTEAEEKTNVIVRDRPSSYERDSRQQDLAATWCH